MTKLANECRPLLEKRWIRAEDARKAANLKFQKILSDPVAHRFHQLLELEEKENRDELRKELLSLEEKQAREKIKELFNPENEKDETELLELFKQQEDKQLLRQALEQLTTYSTKPALH